ncbi:MAG: hypothetical protein ACRDE8_04445, partial [Ginsengibacter sp.]
MFKSFLIYLLFNLFLFRGRDTRFCGRAETDSFHERIERTISFSGYQWVVRNTDDMQGPGPNFFNDSCVKVDDKGWLHLWIKKDSVTGQWHCAEITSVSKFKYGTYQFLVDGAIDRFDKNIVLGLFNYSGNDGFD